jgi:flagellar P-ring protein precursor FlgI
MMITPTLAKFRPAVAALLAFTVLSLLVAPGAWGDNPNRRVLIRDITSVEGVRDNMLVGYGLVAGLTQTGDSQQTYFTVQTLANAMQKMGVLISPSEVEVRNVAAVFVTASLPPFSRPGARLNVTVSSVGDARSLMGGVLLMTALHGPDGQVYAEAQGPLVIGGYSVGNSQNSKQMNSPTVGVVTNGGIVERDTSVDLRDFKTVSLLLHNPDFWTAREIALAVNGEFHKPVASALDSTRVDVNVAEAGAASVTDLIARVQSLTLTVRTPAKIIINERTGTIVLGGDVKLTPVSVIHGNLSIEVVTTYTPVAVTSSAPPGFGGQESQQGGGRGGEGHRGNEQGDRQGDGQGGQGDQGQAGQSGQFNQGGPGGPGWGGGYPGQTALVPQPSVNASDSLAQTMRLDEGANVEELVNGLHAIGTTARDVVAILQAIQAEGGLQAELEVQ